MAFVKTLSRALVTVLRTSVTPHTSKPLQFSLQRCSLSTTSPLASLEEFFEVEKHRGERTIRVGREWRWESINFNYFLCWKRCFNIYCSGKMNWDWRVMKICTSYGLCYWKSGTCCWPWRRRTKMPSRRCPTPRGWTRWSWAWSTWRRSSGSATGPSGSSRSGSPARGSAPSARTSPAAWFRTSRESTASPTGWTPRTGRSSPSNSKTTPERMFKTLKRDLLRGRAG